MKLVNFLCCYFSLPFCFFRGGSFTDDRPDSSRPQTASSSRSDLVYSGRQQKSWKFDGYSSDNDVMPFVHFKAGITLFRTAFRADNPIHREQQRHVMEQVISTHRTSCQSGWPRGFSCLNPSPYSWIFTSVSFRFQSSLLLIPEYPFTLHQSVAQNLSDMWRSTIEIGAEQIRSVREIAPKSPFPCVNRSPSRYGFRTDGKAILNSVNIALKYSSMFNL